MNICVAKMTANKFNYKISSLYGAVAEVTVHRVKTAGVPPLLPPVPEAPVPQLSPGFRRLIANVIIKNIIVCFDHIQR